MSLLTEISRIRSLILEQEEETISKFNNPMKDNLWAMDVHTAQKYVGGYKNYIDIMFDGDIDKYFEELGQKKYYIPNNGMEMYINDAFIDVLGLRPTGWKNSRELGAFTWTSGGMNYRIDVFVTPTPRSYFGLEQPEDQKFWRVIGKSGDSGWGFPFILKKHTIGKRGRQQIFKQIIERFGL